MPPSPGEPATTALHPGMTTSQVSISCSTSSPPLTLKNACSLSDATEQEKVGDGEESVKSDKSWLQHVSMTVGSHFEDRGEKMAQMRDH